MLNLAMSPAVRIFVCILPADMRCQFDGLSRLVTNAMSHDVLTGDYFVFFNRRRTQCKILCWEPGGFALYAKRLAQGTYQRPTYDGGVLSAEVDAVTLAMLLAGVDFTAAKRRSRYTPPTRVVASSTA